ncbi:hypothetical protein O3M35_011220 [Rhynocoris fuscipes]|uniref:Trehalase n=1 Tax=Rhynocoris fuscipes TaxID=488301 RepID=A0AAW1CVF8_9HEMI
MGTNNIFRRCMVQFWPFIKSSTVGLSSLWNSKVNSNRNLLIWKQAVRTMMTEEEYAASIPKEDRRSIYVCGEVLKAIQLADIYKDSKTFVDKRMKYDPIDIHKHFNHLKKEYPNGIPKEQIRKFVDENFEEAEDFEPWIPEDWTPEPSIVKRIYDHRLRIWAQELNRIWKMLARKSSKDVEKNPQRYSLLYLPYGFIIPGGRFRELYYWDTYWIIKGLLICDMFQTAKGCLQNFLYLVETIGHIPNGTRIYYEKRTQPPMLTFIMESYVHFTNDLQFLNDNIWLLDKEMKFWVENRSTEVFKDGVFYRVYRFVAYDPPGPRPEAYKEDITSGKLENTESQRNERYCALKSAAESGWDFSSRWFIFQAQNRGNISNIETQNIIPVDLNALLHKNFVLLSKWYEMFGNVIKSRKYKLLADELLLAIEKIFWNEEEGIWLDYDIMNNIQRNFYYASNFVPLWTESYTLDKEFITYKVIDYMNKFRLEKYVGGTPSSIEFSGEQWDFPNAWPPSQAFLVEGLHKLGTDEAKELALHFADIWVHNNYRTFKQVGVMFEKYDSIRIGGIGDGGEYGIQEGFGWTNGVIFQFLHQYGDQLRAYDTKHRFKEWTPITERS